MRTCCLPPTDSSTSIVSFRFPLFGASGSLPSLVLDLPIFSLAYFLDFPDSLFDFVDFVIDVHGLGDVLKARKMYKQVPKACVSFREF